MPWITTTDTTTVIAVGDRIRIECGPRGAHAGRTWAAFFDGAVVDGVLSIYLDSHGDDLGHRAVLLDKARDLKRGSFVTEMRRNGWTVAIAEPPQSDSGLRVAVLDKDGSEVDYQVGCHKSAAEQAVGYAAARAIYFWWSDKTRELDGSRKTYPGKTPMEQLGNAARANAAKRDPR